MSLDGFSAGPDQDLEHPLGVHGPELMEWFFHTRTWRAMQGQPGGELVQRLEYEASFSESWVRQGEAWLLDHLVPVEKEVEVDRPRAPALFLPSVAAQLALDLE